MVVCLPARCAVMSEQPDSVRLDKWLWSVRFFKTRSLATDAVSSGKVAVDGAKAKPSRPIAIGQKLEIRKGPFTFDVTVEQLVEKLSLIHI